MKGKSRPAPPRSNASGQRARNKPKAAVQAASNVPARIDVKYVAEVGRRNTRGSTGSGAKLNFQGGILKSGLEKSIACDPQFSSFSEFAAYTDEAGHAFQYEAGHLFRSEVGHRTDLKPATLDEAHAGRMG
jgi:hypothetical protein